MIENEESLQLKVAQAVRNSLLNNYDYDISQKRCPKTGRLLGRISDTEIYNLYQISGLDLPKTCERIEKLFIYNSPCLADWIYTDTEALDYHRQNAPREFMFYSIKSLMESSIDYLPYKNKSDFRFTEEGKFLFLCDFCRFAESLDAVELSIAELNRINDKLVLLLSLVGLSTIERLKNNSLSSFDKIRDLIVNHSLAESLEDIVSFLVDKFKLRYAISREQDLSLKDIELIRQAHRKRERDEYAEKANAIKIFREMKRTKDSVNFLNNLVGELFIAQRNSFARELESRKHLPLAEKINKGLVTISGSKIKISTTADAPQFSQLTKINLSRKIVIK